MQALNQKEMIRGQDMGYSINFDDMKNIEGDELNIKLRTPVRNLELAEKKMNKFFVDSLTRFMNTANLMQNNLTEEDQVGMVIWDILPNLVKRLQEMNPKTFAGLYNGLQAIEDEKKQTVRSVRRKNYQTGGIRQGSTNRITNTHTVRAIQQPRRFSNFNQPLSEVLECLVQEGLLRPLINVEPLSSNSPGYDPNKYYNFHQAIGHPTDSCKRLKHEIQNLIDSGKITDPESPSTKINPFPNYRNIPPPATMMINS